MFLLRRNRLHQEQEGEVPQETVEADQKDDFTEKATEDLKEATPEISGLTYAVTQISCYFLASFLFIATLNGLSGLKSARRSIYLAFFGMVIALFATFSQPSWGYDDGFKWLLAILIGGVFGVVAGIKLQMADFPRMLCFFNFSIGLAASMLSVANYLVYFYWDAEISRVEAFQSWVSCIMGNSLAAAAFTVWLKLEKYAYPKSLLTFLAKYQTVITLCTAGVVFLFGLLYIAFLWGLLLFFVGICALWLGFSVFVTISSKDISVVNTFFVCYSGLTIAFIGFMLNNYMVLITGAIITGSSLVLIERVSEAQNVRLMHFFKSKTPQEYNEKPLPNQNLFHQSKTLQKLTRADFLQELLVAKNIVFVPGQGLLFSQSYQAFSVLINYLLRVGKSVTIAHHAGAEKTPGHLVSLLTQYEVPYTVLKSHQKVDFKKADLCVLVGSTDLTILSPNSQNSAKNLENPENPRNLDPNSQTENPELKNSARLQKTDVIEPTGEVIPVWESQKVFVVQTGLEDVSEELFKKNNVFVLCAKNTNSQLQKVVKLFEQKGLLDMSEEEMLASLQQADQTCEKYCLDTISENLNLLKKKCSSSVGIIKESSEEDFRVALCPSVCKQLIKFGFRVYVQQDAGLAAGFSDEEFQDCGAEIAETELEIYQMSQIIVQINAPTFPQVEQMKQIRYLITVFPILDELVALKLTQVNPLCTVYCLLKGQNTPSCAKFSPLDCFVQLEGYRAIVEALNRSLRIPSESKSQCVSFPKSKCLIIGSDPSALHAISFAKLVGFQVFVLDLQSSQTQVLKRFNVTIIKNDLAENEAKDDLEDCFAEEAQQMVNSSGSSSQSDAQNTLSNLVPQIDVLIIFNSNYQFSQELASKMKPFAVIVDCKNQPQIQLENALQLLEGSNLARVNNQPQIQLENALQLQPQIQLENALQLLEGSNLARVNSAAQVSEAIAINFLHLVAEMIGFNKNPKATALQLRALKKLTHQCLCVNFLS